MTSLQLRPDDVRLRVLRRLRACRGNRAYAESLLDCLPGDGNTPRKLHNTCTSLFQHHLVEKVRGMYQLTSDGLTVLERAQ